MKDVFFLGLAASALHRMNLLLWQTWNSSSWGVASMNSATWILRQGGTGAPYPSVGFITIWQYMKSLGSTTPLHWKKPKLTDTSQIWIFLIRELENAQEKSRRLERHHAGERKAGQSDTSMAVTAEEKQTRIVIFPKAPAQHSNTQCLRTKKIPDSSS